jgi:uncharacterized protein
MIEDVLVVDATAHSYNLAEDNYAAGRYSRAVVDAFHGAHYGLSPAGQRIPREPFTRDWKLAETATMLFLESDYDFACPRVTPTAAAYRSGQSNTREGGNSGAHGGPCFAVRFAVVSLSQRGDSWSSSVILAIAT